EPAVPGEVQGPPAPRRAAGQGAVGVDGRLHPAMVPPGAWTCERDAPQACAVSRRLDGVRVRERLGQALFERVAGPNRRDHRRRTHGTRGPRWSRAGSRITRVHGDASMYVGGIRAVLLQTMQPQAMTAVAEHSGYRGDMWGRLARTSRFLAVTTFGTADDAQE